MATLLIKNEEYDKHPREMQRKERKENEVKGNSTV